ncbi:pantoate--beta-alanine ligase [Microvirga sp. VF16]|uniref:pantoate--beta-alanine ligase n=1 Tax=Microvirga sp. VF16 TaxID=2807101 RepID=UPI003530328E
MNTPLARTVEELRKTIGRVAIVPTLGAQNECHLSIVRAALARSQCFMVTLFVNPKQFDNEGDLAAYPRTFDEDLTKLASLGVHLVYASDIREMYPDGFFTTVSVSGVSHGLCGTHRLGHFDGVVTVVTKLFLQTGRILRFSEKRIFSSCRWCAAWYATLIFRSRLPAAPLCVRPTP